MNMMSFESFTNSIDYLGLSIREGQLKMPTFANEALGRLELLNNLTKL